MLPPGGGERTRMHMVAEYGRFGAPVDIDIPDEDDVFDATGFAAQALEQELR